MVRILKLYIQSIILTCPDIAAFGNRIRCVDKVAIVDGKPLIIDGDNDKHDLMKPWHPMERNVKGKYYMKTKTKKVSGIFRILNVLFKHFQCFVTFCICCIRC